MIDDLLRPRSVTELVDAAFQIFRRHPLEFMLAAAAIYIPFLVVRLAVLGGAESDLEQIFRALGLGALSAFVFVVMDAGIIAAASDVYLGRDPNALASIRSVLPRMGSIFAATILRFAALVIGTLLLIIPGIYLTALTFGVTQAIVIERVGVEGAFQRSATLSRGLKMHILTTGFLSLIIWLIATLGLSMAFFWVDSVVAREVVNAALIVVGYPFVAIVKCSLYYDSRIRLEGYDIELLTGAQSAPVADPSHA